MHKNLENEVPELFVCRIPERQKSHSNLSHRVHNTIHKWLSCYLRQVDCTQEALDEVFECNKREYLQIMVRLLPYVMPKATGVSLSEPSERRKLSWFKESEK